MTDRDIKKLIEKLNTRSAYEEVFVRSLTLLVDYAIVWSNTKNESTKVVSISGPFEFYFIKNSQGFYIGAVFNMKNDLHWLCYRNTGVRAICQAL